MERLTETINVLQEQNKAYREGIKELKKWFGEMQIALKENQANYKELVANYEFQKEESVKSYNQLIETQNSYQEIVFNLKNENARLKSRLIDFELMKEG